eukprot:Clim_evm7s73 gene=Clim_evmTU7s73
MSTTLYKDVPGVHSEVPEETKGFVFQQTMLRIKDPKRSLDFYTRIMGMTLAQKLDFEQYGFSLYFMVKVPDPSVIPLDDKERMKWVFDHETTLELTHNYGTEKDDNFSYHDGNKEPKGFGHIGFAVPDVYEACDRFEKLGVEFQKTPNGGAMKGLAFIKDPDGYWIEILNRAGPGAQKVRE